MHLLAQRIGLVEAINRDLHLLKVHLPYHEPDHVLNIAYNILAGGTCLEDLEQRRTDEGYLDGLGTRRTPDPTTAGDFCRRFTAATVTQLMETINQVRLGVWKQQPKSFFKQAVIDADGTLIGYLEGNRRFMRYDEYLAAGYPIGSGVAEGACRHLVKDRMELTGMRWCVPGAQAMLDLRAVYLNDDWDGFQQHRIKQERRRLYPYRFQMLRMRKKVA